MMSILTNRVAVSFSFGLIAAVNPWIAFGCANSSPESSLAQKQGTEYQLTQFTDSSREIKLPAKRALTLTLVSDVPVDGFWSVTVYDERGLILKNSLDAYSLNNITAKREESIARGP